MKLELSTDRIKEHCTKDIGDYVRLKEFQYHHLSDGEFYLFQDNGASVLMVAHLDTFPLHVNFRRKWGSVVSVALDDRLGAYIILEVLPALGIVCDVLLTVGEERGRSTAWGFTPTKEYNWIGSFDRAGTDVVVYNYQDKAWLVALQNVGLHIGSGSYSDIRELEFMGVAGANFGCGYQREHTTNCQAKLRIVRQAIERFAEFYAQHKDTQFVHEIATWEDAEADYVAWNPAWGCEVGWQQCDGCGLWHSVDDIVYDHNHNAYCGDCAYVLEHDFCDVPLDYGDRLPWGMANSSVRF